MYALIHLSTNKTYDMRRLDTHAAAFALILENYRDDEEMTSLTVDCTIRIFHANGSS